MTDNTFAGTQILRQTAGILRWFLVQAARPIWSPPRHWLTRSSILDRGGWAELDGVVDYLLQVDRAENRIIL